MKDPKYFLAAFGKPELPDKDTIDSGRYWLGKRGADTPGDRGDMMLLYQTAVEDDGAMSSPGIGIILTKTKDFIYYRHLPFSMPVPKDLLAANFADEDMGMLAGVKPNTYWMYELSGASFRNATKGAFIEWP